MDNLCAKVPVSLGTFSYFLNQQDILGSLCTGCPGPGVKYLCKEYEMDLDICVLEISLLLRNHYC